MSRMKQINLLKAMWLTWQAGKMTEEQRLALQKQRLIKLVQYAKKNSPYFAELYKDIGEAFNLSDLPPTNKVDLMAHFDKWCTDRSITLEKVNAFMRNTDNIGRLMDKKHLVFTTSGSTGNPSVVIYDQTTMNIASGLSVLRAYARGEDLKAFLKKGKRSASLFADNGFYLGCGSIRYQLHKMPWKKNQMVNIDVKTPMKEIVEKLNSFQPAMLGGYPTALELLADEQKAGRLHIAPAVVMTGGEYLSDTVRNELKNTFGGYVQTNYSCTEGGTVAHECRNQHFHINEEWLIIEAVDKQNRPVPDGVQSDKLLLTNLANLTQPFIRYEVTDRIILHHEPCGCGKTTPWLEIEGRTDDILTFENGVRIAPLSLYVLLKEIHGISRFQLVKRDNNLMELRLIANDKQTAFEIARKQLSEYLHKNGVVADIILSDTEPQVHPKSGKFKHVLYMKE